MIRLTLPHPPSLNKYYRNVRGKTLLSAAGRDYHDKVSVCVLMAGCPHISGRLNVEIKWHPPDKRNRDIDNLTKAVFDALQKAHVFENDGQIDRIVIERCGPVFGGEIIMEISGYATIPT